MGNKSLNTFEDLECCTACRVLRLFIAREVIPVLPREERFRLGDQMLRAARSSTANLAEGYGRFHYMDNAKFCSNARGSCWEVLDHLITAYNEGFIDANILSKGRDLINTAVKLINGYMKYLKKAAKKEDPDNH
jgi:four helix bundle protein